MITNTEKLDLQRMMQQSMASGQAAESGYVDNTAQIRRLKHSARILDDVRTFAVLKQDHGDLKAQDSAAIDRKAGDPDAFASRAVDACAFMRDNYPDLLRRMIRDEIDYQLLLRVIQVLRRIEDGLVDQNEGSVEVGKILKELYVDSALRRSEQLDEKYAAEKPVVHDGKPNCSWRDFKQSL